MPTPAKQLARRRLLAHVSLAAAILGAVALAVWPADRYSWYPACPFARYLHVLCPGCGATRALSALLRGRWGEALQANPLFVALLPLLLGLAAACYRRALRADEFRWPGVPLGVVYTALGGAALFMIARNGWAAGF